MVNIKNRFERIKDHIIFTRLIETKNNNIMTREKTQNLRKSPLFKAYC